MLKGIARELSITIKGNTSCISGKRVKIEESITKLTSYFYVESDGHIWCDEQYRIELKLKEL